MTSIGKILSLLVLLAVLAAPLSGGICECVHHVCAEGVSSDGLPDSSDLPLTDHSGCPSHSHSFVGIIDLPLVLIFSSTKTAFFEAAIADLPEALREIDYPPQLS